MNIRFAAFLGSLILSLSASAATIVVPGRADPWLAGMTNGGTARKGDSAPDESPVVVTGIPVVPGATYVFSVSGKVNHGGWTPLTEADGENVISHYLGAENGVGDVTAPFDSLIGVFLESNQPDSNSNPPPPLDFGTSMDRNYIAITPALRQPFFIGDGLNDSGAAQKITAPAGASRLFLGVMDEYRWNDNKGSFDVRVTQVTQSMEEQHSTSANPNSVNQTTSPPGTGASTSSSMLRLGLHPSSGSSPAEVLANPYTATTSELQIHAYNAIELSWSSETNRLYRVQWTPDLNPPVWNNLYPVVSGTGAEVSIFDSTRIHPAGFYRVEILQ